MALPERFYPAFDPSPSTNYNVVERGIELANSLVMDEAFFDAIRVKVEPFDSRYTDEEATPEFVADYLKSDNDVIYVHVEYHRKYKVLGWRYTGNFNDIYVNSRRLGRTAESFAATFIHEWIHCVEDQSELDFHHGGNSSRGKENSAPYWIGNLAIRLLRGATTDFLVDGEARFFEGVTPAELNSFEIED